MSLRRQGQSTGLRLLSGRNLPMNVAQHHQGMRWLKEFFGDPKPAPEYQLSLQVIDGLGVYWAVNTGSNNYKGKVYKRLPYKAALVSRFPDDYKWETAAENRETDRERRRALLEREVCRG